MKAARVLKFHQEGSIQKWQVIIPAEHNEGKRWFRRFETKKEAEAFADKFSRDPWGTVAELRGLKTAARPAVLARTDRENAEYIWKHLVAKFATNSVAEGIKAIDYYFNTHHAVNRITVADAVREYHAHRATKALTARTRSDDEDRLKRLVIQFGASDLASITTKDLREFFARIPDGHDGTGSNRITARTKIGTFFSWACAEGNCLRENPITPIKKEKDLGRMGVNKDYYTSDLFRRMLRITAGVEPVTEGGERTTEFRGTLYPWFVASGFLGIRTKEIIRKKVSDDALRWSDCKFNLTKESAKAYVQIRPEVGKGGQDGKIEAAYGVAAFQAWLPKPLEDGFVCPALSYQIQAAKKRFTELTGIEFHENGLRNSFATYARSYTQSKVLAAEQLRNDPAVAKKYYIVILPEPLGREFFGLRPLEVFEEVA